MAQHFYDYIIVGAGSAGAVIAARLSEDLDKRILLIEAGGRDTNPWIHTPLGVGKLLTNPSVVWQYFTDTGIAADTPKVYWPKGKTLGGSSSVNGMVYSRGSRRSWDEWRDLGNLGWSYDDILPYFKRLERRLGGDPSYRGDAGPISVTDVAHRSAVSQAFIEACHALGAPKNDDYNGPSDEGVAPLQMTVHRGKRCSTAVAYLKPARRRKNLTVVTETMVNHLLFDGRRCVGVSGVRSGNPFEAHASREVILSAGSIESPAILERSGIGNPAILAPLGIELRHGSEQVGENLQDHLQVRMSFEIVGETTVNDLMNKPILGAIEGLRYWLTRRGLLTTSSVTAHAIMKSHQQSSHPDTKIQIALISGKDRYSGNGSGLDQCAGITLGTFQIRPVSRGGVHVTSADPTAPPSIRPNYLNDPVDRQHTLSGLKLIREVVEQSALKPYIKQELLPGTAINSDEALLRYAAETGQTSWHPIGTCRMGSDAKSVVDPQLRVRGFDGLRVADASIMPTMVSTNTNAPTILIGEKAADLIRQARLS